MCVICGGSVCQYTGGCQLVVKQGLTLMHYGYIAGGTVITGFLAKKFKNKFKRGKG